MILENTITHNLEWTIENFNKSQKGYLTFPTKFDMVEPILNLNHNGKIIVRMSINPEEIINKIEFGTSRLNKRIEAINKLKNAGYKIGILIAPIVLVDNWKMLYENVIAQMLTANGHNLYFYTHYNDEKHRNDIEIDFVLSNNSKLKYKIYPIEVKSGERYTTTSLVRFKEKFKNRIRESYIIHPRN